MERGICKYSITRASFDSFRRGQISGYKHVFYRMIMYDGCCGSSVAEECHSTASEDALLISIFRYVIQRSFTTVELFYAHRCSFQGRPDLNCSNIRPELLVDEVFKFRNVLELRAVDESAETRTVNFR